MSRVEEIGTCKDAKRVIRSDVRTTCLGVALATGLAAGTGAYKERVSFSGYATVIVIVKDGLDINNLRSWLSGGGRSLGCSLVRMNQVMKKQGGCTCGCLAATGTGLAAAVEGPPGALTCRAAALPLGACEDIAMLRAESC